MNRRQAFLVLNALPNIGPINLNRLLDAFDGDPVAIFSAAESRLKTVRGVGDTVARTIREWKEHFDLEREEKQLEKSGAAFVTCRDGDYPRLLKEIPDPPIGLYWKGEYKIDRPCLAVVGSRRTTLYGQNTARKLGMDLARAGFCVVSGMARGIDTAAHEGALAVEGKTVAVLGCGLDIIYPPENLDLYRRIAAEGAVVSEFCFGRRADRQSFPMRNRIVAGLCDGMIVVESDVNGGSMITARFAGEQGRIVFAVPGRIDQASSRGCHQLLRDGAILCRGVEDVIEEFSYLSGLRPCAAGGEEDAEASDAASGLDETEQGVLARLREGAGTIDSLAASTGMDASKLASLLMILELKRFIVKRMDGSFEAR